MERSWWIILVLICNLAYGQINSGAIGNNRFLQRTNPQITRALNDGGSSLDHPEVQKLARQMVDLGIWSNLVFWVHEGLVKERVSGSDVFVPTGYDISGQLNDAVQTDTLLQPKISTVGLSYDGINDFLGLTNSSVNTSLCTVMGYVYYNNLTTTQQMFNRQNASLAGTVSVLYSSATNDISFRLRLSATPNTARILTWTSTPSVATYYHFAGTYDGATMRLYVNGSQINTLSISGTINTNTYNATNIGMNITNVGNHNGIISDVRYFNTALTASQIDAIFQETRGKYGI
jgi:hypothetical protein